MLLLEQQGCSGSPLNLEADWFVLISKECCFTRGSHARFLAGQAAGMQKGNGCNCDLKRPAGTHCIRLYENITNAMNSTILLVGPPLISVQIILRKGNKQ